MTERFPGYDVLAKRHTLSWNEATRRVVDQRLAVHPGPRFFTPDEWPTVCAICARILPQPKDRSPVPIPAYIDDKLLHGKIDGYRDATLPHQGDAWRIAVAALDAQAREAHGRGFADLDAAGQDALLTAMQKGELAGERWQGMPSDVFFAKRVLHDVTNAYYAHPTAWSEMGFAGPASPRGYVRMDANQRDPWEAAEAYPDRGPKAAAEAFAKNKTIV